MSEDESTEAGRSPFPAALLIGAGIVFVAIFAAVLLFPVDGKSIVNFGARDAPKASSRFARVNEADALTAAVDQTFRTHFKAEAAMLDAELRRVDGSQITGAEADAIRYRIMRQAMLDNVDHTAAAPRDHMLEMIRSQRDLIVALQLQDEKLCADFGLRGLGPETRLNTAAQSLADVAGLAQLRATAAGRADPTRWPPPTRLDGVLLVRRLEEQALGPALIGKMAGNLQDASIEDQCRGSVALYRALAELPPETGARLMSGIVRESARILQQSR